MREKFPGVKVQKISVNAGFSCPNRDGTIGTGGCIYCDNTSFTPGYCFDIKDIRSQLEAGKQFFARKYPKMKYLAYFQSFSNTFGKSENELERMYREAMEVEDVVGVIVGTRPDTLPDSVVEIFRKLNREKPVIVEIGAETSHDETLIAVNRHHTWSQVVDAVERLHEAGVATGLHLIAGLPGETAEMILETVRNAVELPIESIKMHHLQVLKGTELARLENEGKLQVPEFSIEEYVELCSKIINLVPRNIAIERFLAGSPPDKVLKPKWGLKNYQFANLLSNRLRERNSASASSQ